MKIPIRLVAITIAISASLALTGISAREAAAQKALQMAELSISYSAVTHLAEMLGYIRSENALVTIMPVAAGPDAVSALRSRAGTELATIAVTPVVTLIASGQQPVVLATTILSDQQVQLVTFSETGITAEPSTLRARRIGRVRNTVGEIYLSRLLAKANLAPKDVTLIDGKPADLVNLLIRGDIDAAVLWDPFVATAKRAYRNQVERRVVRDRGAIKVFVDPKLYTLAFNVVSTKQKLAGNEAAVENLLRALIRTEEYMRRNPSDAQQRLEAWLNLQPGDLDHFMHTTSFKVGLNVPQMKKWLSEELAWLGTVQDVRDPPTDMSPFVDPSPLFAVDPSRVTER